MKNKQKKASADGGIPGSTFTLPPRLLAVGEILLRKRINPISRAIEQAKLIPSPSAQYKAWLDIAEFVYSKPKSVVETPAQAAQSSVNAKQAHKLLSALEDAAKQAGNLNGQKAHQVAAAPNDGITDSGSSQSSLGDGAPTLQA